MRRMKKVAVILTAMLWLPLMACQTSERGAGENQKVEIQAETETAAESELEATETTGADTTQETDTAQAAVETTYPVTITDMAGREVVVKEEPKRIVSGYYISSSACIALGLEDRMAGIEAKAESRPIYELSAPQLLEVPTVGTAKDFDLETCLSTEPDLVILPMKQKEVAETLTEMGIPTIVVLPESHEQILQMFDLIGTATNTTDKSKALVSYYEEKLKEVENLTADLKDSEKPSVYIGGTGNYLTTAPAGMYQAALIDAAGGVNAADEIEGESWVEVSYEQLLAMNPEVMIVPTDSFASAEPDYTVGDILADPQLSEVTAVSEKAVYQMPTGFEAWDSPAPSGILGTLWMLNTLHPDLYSEDAFLADVTWFYETFYGFTPSFTK